MDICNKMIFENIVCILLFSVAQFSPLTLNCDAFFMLIKSYVMPSYSCFVLYPKHIP